jgi:environmental stress-induced protein Ves
MSGRVWRAAERPAQPWRNGGGVTREVARHPAELAPDRPAAADFDWRVSVAEVERDGPFSAFEGVDRVIVLVDGAAMTLTVDGVPHELQRHRPFAFDGGRPTSVHLPAGPTRDLNVMTARGRVRAAVGVVEVGPGAPVAVQPGAPLLLVVLTGPLTVTPPTGPAAVLGPLDALEWPGDEPVQVTGAGALVSIRISYGATGFRG